jgi:hypothetical protein
LSPSLPFLSSRLSPPIGWVMGESLGHCPWERFPVTSGIAVALLVCLRSLRIHRLWKWPASREEPRGSYHLPQPRGSRVWTEYKFRFDLVF